MANPFSDPEYTKKYQSDLATRFNSAADKASQEKIRAEMNRIASKTGVGVDISGGKAYLGGTAPKISSDPTPKISADPVSTYNNAPTAYSPTKFKLSQVQTPSVSWTDAMEQAQAQLDPIRTQARNAAGVASQQQMSLLRQKLAASGSLGDGGYGRALANMSTQHQETLNNMDSNYGVQLANLAQGIVNRDTQAQQQAYRDALTRWQMENSMGLQAAQNNRMLDRDAASDKQFGMNYASNLLPYFLMTEAQRQGIPLEWTQLMGQVPGQTANTNGIDPNKLMQIVNMLMGGGY